jgi:gamma-glutamylcyclotransferase (GGCT)/AIG2-like uncharacterized protein YtfP
MNKTLISVYGSLRKTMSNHNYFLSTSKYKGTFSTEPEFTLHSLGSYPGLKKSGNTSVVMEVYEVEDDVLKRLNRLEGYDTNTVATFYDRIELQTPWGVSFVYVYVNDLPKHSIVESGDWVKYKNEKLEYQSLSNN